MHISELRIRNFRNFLKGRFVFRKGVNTLIGENGSGKTNALHALRLLLDDTLPRNATCLREADFSRALGDWKGHWIVIAVDFEELDPSEGCQILKHATGHMDESDTGTHTLLFRPRLEIRKRLHEMTCDGKGKNEIREHLDSITVDAYESVLTGRAEADFLEDDTYTRLVGNFEDGLFPNPDDDDQAELGVKVGPLHPEISCTFAPALRDVMSDLRGYRSNPLLALLRGTESSIQIEDAQKITAVVSQLNKDISSLDEIKKIAAGVQSTLHSTVGHTYSPGVAVESTLPDSIDKLLQRLTVKVGEGGNSSYRGDIAEQSLGGANLIYLALKLLEYELKLSSDRVAHFLLIEEPEAHIHTHIQKTLFENQSAHRTQVIVSTHSTHVSSAAKIRSVNVLAQRGDCAEVFQPSRGLGEVTAHRVERYLDAVRSTLLFAKGVVLVEGDAELMLVPSMTRAAFGLLPDEMGISVISMGSAFFEHVAIVFHADRIHRRCAIVTDRDQSLVELPDNPEDDDAEQSHCRAAQREGERRQAALDDFTRNNDWVKAFFADHTFEVDFLAAGNADEVCEVVAAMYSQAAAKRSAQAAIRSQVLAESGAEILRLASTVGKGWFSLLLSEKLQVNTCILDYISRAVAFAAASSITPNALKQMGLFRLKDQHFSDEIRGNLPSLEELQKLTADNFVEAFVNAAPDDDLAKLIGYLNEYAAG